ncbi:axin interactor, dorsalization-associated protein-like [Tubulanus polymorphus]|uniref:axin interactor, dorsalization-associated protein-like n=1 Tax=Tubulanus polymorphus TaxID=672921 RepID=UPI003DA65A1D
MATATSEDVVDDLLVDDDFDQSKLIQVWWTILKKSTDYDAWGQPVEAVEGYKQLSQEIPKRTRPDQTYFTDDQKKVLQKLVVCLELRSQALQNPQRSMEVTLDHLKRILSGLPSLFGITSIENEGKLIKNSSEAPASLVSLPPLPGQDQTKISLWIEKLGIKDAPQYIDSFITVAVKDAKGIDLNTPIDTPMSNHRDENYVYFGSEITIERPLECLPTGFAIFLEFRHYKPKKKTVSTKCWTFLERDEIKDGPVIAELYKKPTDCKRKSINLLTTKPLYLHAKLTLT